MGVRAFNRAMELNYSWVVAPADVEREVDYTTESDCQVDGGQIIFIGTLSNKMPQFKDVYRQLLAFEQVDEAMNYLKDKDSQAYILKTASIISCLLRESRKRTVAQNYKFNIPLIDVNDGKTQIFVGTTGIGKKIFALSHFDSPLLISDRQDFGSIDSCTDRLVIDDFTFRSWVVTNVLHTCDLSINRSINVKYDTAVIPAYMPRIITTNDISLFWPVDILPKTRDAIDRRIVIHDFESNLIYLFFFLLFNEIVQEVKQAKVECIPEPQPVTESLQAIQYGISSTILTITEDASSQTLDPPILSQFIGNFYNVDLDASISVINSAEMFSPSYASTPKQYNRLVDYSDSHISMPELKLPGNFFVDIEA